MTVVAHLKTGWEKLPLAKIDRAMISLMADVESQAAALAPKDTRALVNSGRIEKLGKFAYAVTFGGDKVPYARIQELGGKAGRNHAATIIGQHYLEKAGQNVVRTGVGKYLK